MVLIRLALTISFNKCCLAQVSNKFAGLLSELPRGTPLVLVNAAGIAVDGLLARTRDTDAMEQIGVNLLGPMYVIFFFFYSKIHLLVSLLLWVCVRMKIILIP